MQFRFILWAVKEIYMYEVNDFHECYRRRGCGMSLTVFTITITYRAMSSEMSILALNVKQF